MNIPRNLLLAALLMSAGNTFAASSIDLSVKGSITPSACVPTLGNGGNYDTGKISAKDLRVEQFTRLEKQSLPFEVTCEGPTLIALQGKDNREGTEWQDEGFFGLGLVNGNEKLGSFVVNLMTPVADGVPVRIIESLDGGMSWMAGGQLWRGSVASVANDSILAPLPVQSLAINMVMQGFIAPAKNLTLTNEVPIDGSVTVTVLYL